jgi:hypothetical protein
MRIRIRDQESFWSWSGMEKFGSGTNIPYPHHCQKSKPIIDFNFIHIKFSRQFIREKNLRRIISPVFLENAVHRDPAWLLPLPGLTHGQTTWILPSNIYYIGTRQQCYGQSCRFWFMAKCKFDLKSAVFIINLHKTVCSDDLSYCMWKINKKKTYLLSRVLGLNQIRICLKNIFDKNGMQHYIEIDAHTVRYGTGT